MSEGLTAAIVGLSWIGADPAFAGSDAVLGTAVPYSHASAYAATPEVTRIVGCDTSAEARAAFEREWSGRYPGLRTYADASEMIADARPDILSVVTPDHLHARFAIEAMDAGVPRIFCEKPLAVTLDDADAIIAAAARTGATVTVNYTRHWVPDHVGARAQVRAGGIGALSQIIMQIGGPRMMLYRNLTHSLDLMSFYAESDPAWVVADLEPGFEDYREYRGNGQDPELEPGANVYVVFENGVRGYLAGQKSMPPGEITHLVGSTGRIAIDFDGVHVQTPSPDGVISRRLVPQYTLSGMTAAVRELLDCHERGVATSSSPELARRAIVITNAILESHARGNVRVDVTREN